MGGKKSHKSTLRKLYILLIDRYAKYIIVYSFRNSVLTLCCYVNSKDKFWLLCNLILTLYCYVSYKDTFWLLCNIMPHGLNL